MNLKFTFTTQLYDKQRLGIFCKIEGAFLFPVVLGGGGIIQSQYSVIFVQDMELKDSFHFTKIYHIKNMIKF